MSVGRPPGTGHAAARVLAVLQTIGTDADGRYLSLRSPELCVRARVDAGNLARIVQPLIDAGQVLVCKVTVPGERGGSRNEYRAASGTIPAWVPLNTRRSGIAHGAPSKPLPVTKAAPSLSTARPGLDDIKIPVLGHPQPAVGQNSGSRKIGKSPTTPSPEAPAVAAKATPAPDAGVALKKEPTTRSVPAGDVAPRPQRINGNDGIALRIDHDGTLLIATDEGVLEIDPKQCRRLGHFMADTHGVWNPF